ncbi:Homeodomain-like protein [Aspergillus aurantiobrunneus]
MTEPRRRWTSAEDALLWDLYQVQEKAPTGKCQKVNWNEIARHIPGRSNKDCRKRYYNRFTGGLRKGSWMPEEDERLFQLVERYQYRWATIAQKMETRNADQCSKRWHHCLNPELERSPWTDEENTLLLSAVNTHGSGSWKDIQTSHFPTRSANNIKNQYTILSRKCLSPVHLQPCCGSPPKTKSSRRSASSAPVTTGSHGFPGYDPYNYSSSPTPQPPASEYLPETPETGSISGLDFHTPMGLPTDPCGYIPQYQPSLFPNMPGSSDLMMGDPTGMRYGLDLSYSQDALVQPFHSGQAYGF